MVTTYARRLLPRGTGPYPQETRARDWQLIQKIASHIKNKLGETSAWHIFFHEMTQLNPDQIKARAPTFSNLNGDWMVVKNNMRYDLPPERGAGAGAWTRSREASIYSAYNYFTHEVRFAPASEKILRSIPNGYPGPTKNTPPPSLLGRYFDVFG